MPQKRALTIQGPRVSRLGIASPPAAPPDTTAAAAARRRSNDLSAWAAWVETLEAAIDAGINLVDLTAAGPGGPLETEIAGVIARRTERIFIATETAPSPGPRPPGPYCRWQDRYPAAYLRDHVDRRLRAMGTERLDLHRLQTWSPAWNDDPQPLLVLRQLREEGKIGLIGVRAPLHEQNCVIQLMRDGMVDVIQIVFNLFEQDPAAQLLTVAEETGTGVLAYGSLDAGILTAKYSSDSAFADGDPRRDAFTRGRMRTTQNRIAEIRADLRHSELDDLYTPTDVALQFAMSPNAVSSVIVGMRSVDQVHANLRCERQLPPLPDDLMTRLRRHCWRRGLWQYGQT